MHDFNKGSEIAKNGFKNEDDIITKFNNWQTDIEAQKWLTIMQYDLKEIESVTAIKIVKAKADVQVQVRVKLKSLIDAQNIQVKLVSNKRGFNQIDKRWVSTYAELWDMPENIQSLLKRYCGEVAPTIANPKDKRRMYVTEFSIEEQLELVSWFENNKTLIVNGLLKDGDRGRETAKMLQFKIDPTELFRE